MKITFCFSIFWVFVFPSEYLTSSYLANKTKGITTFSEACDGMKFQRDIPINKGKTVTLDYYFNHEMRKDKSGKTVQTHYIWEEKDNGGYSTFGDIFHKYRMQTNSLKVAPTVQNLKNTSIYIIVDPDDERESEHPNYINADDINSIYTWVKNGGVLLLFGNDSANVEFTHFNHLVAKFGIQFNFDCINKETENNFEMAKIDIAPGNVIFKDVKKVYIKGYSSLTVNPPAKQF